MNYKVISNTTGLKIGQVVSEEYLKANNPGLGGSERLLRLKAVEATSDPVTANPDDISTPEKAQAREAQATGFQNTKTAGVETVAPVPARGKVR